MPLLEDWNTPILHLGGFRWFCLDLDGFRWISCIPGAEGLSACGSLKAGAAAPLTNLCSDAGVGRRLGCLDISYLGGFHGFQGQKVCQRVAALREELWPL